MLSILLRIEENSLSDRIEKSENFFRPERQILSTNDTTKAETKM